MNDANAHHVCMVGLLKPGMALKRAQAALTVLAQQLAHTPIAKDQTASTTHLTVKRASFLDFGGTGAEFAVSVTLALAGAGMVLLVTCANVANLLLTKLRNFHRGKRLPTPQSQHFDAGSMWRTDAHHSIRHPR